LSTYPEVHLELAVSEAPIDLVAKGFDAGIGPRERAPADMIAVRVMGPMKVAVVGAPAYFARRRPPRAPDDLAQHSCIQFRRAGDGAVFVWPFERNRQSRRISVDGRVMVNDPDLAVRAAVDGLGIAYTIEALAEPFLRSGRWPGAGRLVATSKDCFCIIPGTGRFRPRCALIDMIHRLFEAGAAIKNPFTKL
jgi:DNA-binding transcriptional LysR family regulator